MVQEPEVDAPDALNAVVQGVSENHSIGVHFLRDCVRVTDSDDGEVLS